MKLKYKEEYNTLLELKNQYNELQKEMNDLLSNSNKDLKDNILYQETIKSVK